MLLLVGTFELLLALFTMGAWAVGFVVVTSLSAGVIESDGLRLAIGGLFTLVLPLLWHRRLGRRYKLIAGAPIAFVALCSVLLGIGLSMGFADDVGRALRRHGDWFLGERNGAVARATRFGVALVAARLERFDPPRELGPDNLSPIPVDPRPPAGPFPSGLWPPGPVGPLPPGPAPQQLAWFHPLAGAERAMPGSEGRRFGATRPPPRPAECELGHCGVDLGYAFGQAVVAIHDGIIERIENDEASGGRAGRYVRIGHRGGTVVSRYIHLESIRADLRPGMSIHGGELIGRVGRTGVEHSGPHLHFGLSLRPGGSPGGSESYVDPEPLLRRWSLAELPGTSTQLARNDPPPRR